MFGNFLDHLRVADSIFIAHQRERPDPTWPVTFLAPILKYQGNILTIGNIIYYFWRCFPAVDEAAFRLGFRGNNLLASEHRFDGLN